MACDPLYNYRALGLHFDGTDGSTTFTDNSPTPKTPTVNGNAQISTARSVFGGASGLFDGTGDYLQYAYHADFAFGSGDFEIEVAYYNTNNSIDQALVYFGLVNAASGFDIGYGFVHFGSSLAGKLRFFCYVGGTQYNCDSVSALTLNAWNRIKVIRTNGNLKLFLEGALIATTAITGAFNNSTSYVLKIGRYVTSTPRDLNGNLDELIMLKGIVRDSAAYTLPATAWPDSQCKFSGNITESSPITDWRVSVSKASDATLINTGVFTGATYTLDVATTELCTRTISPKIDYQWSANKVSVTGDFMVASNPETTPHLFKVTTGGDFGATEPTYDTTPGNTTAAGVATLTCIGQLVDPVTNGPKIPV